MYSSCQYPRKHDTLKRCCNWDRDGGHLVAELRIQPAETDWHWNVMPPHLNCRKRGGRCALAERLTASSLMHSSGIEHRWSYVGISEKYPCCSLLKNSKRSRYWRHHCEGYRYDVIFVQSHALRAPLWIADERALTVMIFSVHSFLKQFSLHFTSTNYF